MITQVSFSIRSAKESDRFQLSSLIQLEPYVHRHLDWRPPLDWLGHQPFLVAERKQNLVAALASPPDPLDVAWIRTFAAAGHIPTRRIWHSLWEETRGQLAASGVECTAALPLYRWFRELLEASDFEKSHNVVVLAWEERTPPKEGHQSNAHIRSMTEADLPAVTEVDNAAFKTIWRNSFNTLNLAYQQAVCATVAEDDSGIIGYQISTPSPYGWHLARLAVHPDRQRSGVAYALTRHLLIQSLRRGEAQVSVNTQHDNEASLQLYQRIGFYRTGEEYPVYQYYFD